MKIIERDGTVKECEPEQELSCSAAYCGACNGSGNKTALPRSRFLLFGPATERGFYYDVDLGDTKLTDEDLLKNRR